MVTTTEYTTTATLCSVYTVVSTVRSRRTHKATCWEHRTGGSNNASGYIFLPHHQTWSYFASQTMVISTPPPAETPPWAWRHAQRRHDTAPVVATAPRPISMQEPSTAAGGQQPGGGPKPRQPPAPAAPSPDSHFFLYFRPAQHRCCCDRTPVGREGGRGEGRRRRGETNVHEKTKPIKQPQRPRG